MFNNFIINRISGMPSEDAIYVSIITPEPIFAYVRAIRNGEVGFSVLDVATSTPDFSNCGVFWVKAKDFARTFKYYASRKLAPKIC